MAKGFGSWAWGMGFERDMAFYPESRWSRV